MNNRILLGIIAGILFCLFACNKQEITYNECFRPLIHFSSEKNWTGEPTGLLYDKDEYHLFYQYNPDQPVLGNISWGHAVSNDLLNWRSAPLAITPDSSGQIYPGSVITDPENTSGLGSTANPAWIAFYTYHNTDKAKPSEQSIMLAYSTNKGGSWEKRPTSIGGANSGITFRNPHVSWNDLCKQWLMTVSTGSTIQLFTSPDCLHWSYLSEFGNNVYSEGGWEGSDLFPLPITGSNSTKWVLLVSMNGGPAGGAPATRYFVGEFDGRTFKPTQMQELWIDYGKDNFASATYNDITSNRRIMLGWMNSWDYANLTPTQTKRGSMTLPRELSLIPEGDYFLLSSSPVRELSALYGKTDSITNIKLAGSQDIFSNRPFPALPFVMQLSFDNSCRHAIWTSHDYGIRFKTKSGRSLSIGYKADMNYFYTNRSGLMECPFSDSFEQPTGAIYTSQNPVSYWYILVDHGSVELFACGNRIAMTSLCFQEEAFDSFELFAESGTATALKVSITELNNPIK